MLITNYLHAMFFMTTRFVGDLSPIAPGSIPAETWNEMSPTAKALGPQLGGWAICYSIIIAGFLYFEPTQRTHQLISKLNAFIMLVWWPTLWYGAMLPNKDYAPIDAMTYVKAMTIGETVLGLVYAYCGWCVDASEEVKVATD